MSVTTSAATAVKATFNGATSSGAIAVPGLNAGDAMVRCIPDGFTQGFEAVVSAIGQLQQIENLDWSGVTFTAYFLRGV